ncbi:peptidoglycan D,D-transpeptidase FtsI family protein [Anaerocolumna sedimenticola]|nr:penicillin-binding transpeptidase domain-containing protein [Anaerocolumna sedimenticola]
MKKEKEKRKSQLNKRKTDYKSDQFNTLTQIVGKNVDEAEENLPEKKPAASKKEQTNKEIMLITYIFIGLFVLVLGYITNFMISDSSEVINNAYNGRQDLLAEQIIRGDIISADSKILAHTVTEKNGKEKRVYPYGSMYAHVVGRFSKGKTGLEASENFHLLTSNNNAISKMLREISGEKNIGDNIITTLDSKLQEAAYNALGNYKGAVVVTEPSSGKILAMVSKPDYDPNNIDTLWEDLLEDSDNNSALINRAAQGLYPPGSTFKILTALEYMKENPDYKKYTYNCVGKGKFNDVTINCYNNNVHGKEDIIESFAKSCNSSFANIGITLNISSFRKLCDSFLFNAPLPTNLVYNQSSFVLNSKSSKMEIPQTVIGQGKTQITPLHNALIVSTIANGGVMMKPYVVDHIENQNGNITKKYMPEMYKTVITPDEAGILTDFMREVVKHGTASALNNNDYTIAGKTGSAEYQEDKPAHAWFVGFAPAEKPEIAVSIIVESVGTGSEYAVPIASAIFKTYFDNK